jgi:hypothetical protein
MSTTDDILYHTWIFESDTRVVKLIFVKMEIGHKIQSCFLDL